MTTRRDELLEELESVRSTLYKLEESLDAKREALQSTVEESTTVKVVPSPRDESRDEPTWELGETVRVVPAEEFDAWVERQRASKVDGGVDDAGGDPIAAGRQLFNDTGCNACHTLADAGATGAAGPALDDLAAQAERLGRAEGLTAAEFVETSIVDPDATVAEGYQPGIMPTDYGDRLSPAQLQTLVDYLLEVSGGGSSQ